MSAPDPISDPPGDDGPPADEELARTYANGFGEGLRTALKDILQHVSQGYTASELRLLVQGRLVRVSDEIELKRRSLLGPPRPRVEVLFPATPPPPRTWSVTGGTPRIVPGGSYLVNEPRPARALDLLTAAVGEFPRTIVLSLHPPALPALPSDRRVEIALSASPGPGEAPAAVPLGQVGGRLREAMAAGSCLVYVDALEFLCTGATVTAVAQFLFWLTDAARRSGSAVVASVNSSTFDLKQYALLQRSFQTQA